MLKIRIRDTALEKTLVDFAEGRISLQRAMYVLDVDYSDLWDMMAERDLPLPELSDEEARAEGKKIAEFLAAMEA
jgi:predicted HTH domain antitoxin